MIIRKLAEAIREQNWFTVVLEILIVVFGVYIGIFISDIQRQRILHEETLAALTVLQNDLKSDVARLDVIVSLHSGLAADRALATQLLAEGSADEAQLNRLFIGVLTRQDMFFPNTSTYQTMRDSGYITQIRNTNLRQSITTLFDRDYERIGSYVNTVTIAYERAWEAMVDANWDVSNGRYWPGAEPRPHLMANNMAQVDGLMGHYTGLLSSLIRPTMMEAIEQIDIYVSSVSQ